MSILFQGVDTLFLGSKSNFCKNTDFDPFYRGKCPFAPHTPIPQNLEVDLSRVKKVGWSSHFTQTRTIFERASTAEENKKSYPTELSIRKCVVANRHQPSQLPKKHIHPKRIFGVVISKQHTSDE